MILISAMLLITVVRKSLETWAEFLKFQLFLVWNWQIITVNLKSMRIARRSLTLKEDFFHKKYIGFN